MTLATERAHAIWFSTLDRWVVPTVLVASDQLPTDWQVVRVDNLVRQVSDRVRVKPTDEYKMLGVRWYGEGVFHRETVSGERMSASWVTPAVPGAFIYNRLFAWKASFAVVPAEHGDGFVSGEFPQFMPVSNKVLSDYLYLYFMSPSALKAVNRDSVGSAAVSRNRFKEAFFLKYEIPLPPLETQRAILREWQKAKARIMNAQRKAKEQESTTESGYMSSLGIASRPAVERPRTWAAMWSDVVRFSTSGTLDGLLGLSKPPESRFPFVPLGQCAHVSYGIQKSPANRPNQHARPYLRVANVRKGYLDLTEIKTIDVGDAEMASYRLEPGDLLFVEGNGSKAELGRVAQWHGELSDCVHQNHLIKVRCDLSRLLPEFAATWFNTEIGRSHFFRAAKSSSGLGTINSREVRNAPVPLPPLNTQHKIMAKVSVGRAHAAREREMATELGKQIEADMEAYLLGTKPVPKGKRK